MSDSNKSISPLRQRMVDDMRLRKLSAKTQTAYIRAVKNFTRFLRRPPPTPRVPRISEVISCT